MKEPDYKQLARKLKESQKRELDLEQKVQELDAKLAINKLVLDELPKEITVMIGNEEEFIYISPSARLLFEADNEGQIRETSFLSLIRPDYHEIIKSFRKRVFLGEKQENIEVILKTLKGNEKDALITSAPFLYEGKPAAHNVIFDITEQRKSEVILKSFFKNFEGALYVKDLEGVYLLVNDRYENIVGLPIDEVIGKNDYELFPERQAKEFIQNDNEVMRTGVSTTFKEVVPCHNGIVYPGLSTKFPIIDAEGNVRGSAGVTVDISEQEGTNSRLVESEEKHRSLIELLTEGLITIQDRKIVFANDFAANTFGFKREEILNTEYLSYFPQKEHQRMLEIAEYRYQGEETPEEIVYEGIHKSGEPVFIESKARIIHYEGKPAVLSTFKDVTNRLKIEERELQSQKMQAIGTLAGGIAHDFNNILSPIFAYSQLLSRKLENQSDTVKKYIEGIQSAVKRAARLISQILLISRTSEPETAIVDVMPVVKESMKFLRSTLPSTIEIKTVYNAKRTFVDCDPTQIQQVLLNMGTNASHAMEEGGLLEFKVSNFRQSKSVDYIQKGDYLLFTVRDTGTGMTSEIKERIFEPFFSTKVGKGTGLGLSTCYGIVKSLEGDIQVYSEPGKGTKFLIYIPVENVKLEETELIEERIQEGSESILLVDDEEANIESHSELLGSLGYKVTCFTNSEQALNEILNNPNIYDLVLTDQTMPNYTGIELSEQIRKHNNNIPIAIISGLPEVIPKADIEKNNICFILAKPLILDVLSSALREIFYVNEPNK